MGRVAQMEEDRRALATGDRRNQAACSAVALDHLGGREAHPAHPFHDASGEVRQLEMEECLASWEVHHEAGAVLGELAQSREGMTAVFLDPERLQQLGVSPTETQEDHQHQIQAAQAENLESS